MRYTYSAVTFARSFRRHAGWVALGIGLYALTLVASPLLHQDLACHFKAPGHCIACMASPVATPIEAGVGLAPPNAPRAGSVEGETRSVPAATFRSTNTGRAPPSVS